MKHAKTIEDYRPRLWKSKKSLRTHLLKCGYRPLILTDGKDRFWNGFTALGEGYAVLLLDGLQGELLLMIREQFFPEAAGILVDDTKWWTLRDAIAGDTYCQRKEPHAAIVSPLGLTIGPSIFQPFGRRKEP